MSDSILPLQIKALIAECERCELFLSCRSNPKTCRLNKYSKVNYPAILEKIATSLRQN